MAEDLEAEIEEIVQAYLDQADGNVDQALAGLSALMSNHPELRERYLKVAIKAFLEPLLDEWTAEDKRNSGTLS